MPFGNRIGFQGGLGGGFPTGARGIGAGIPLTGMRPGNPPPQARGMQDFGSLGFGESGTYYPADSESLRNRLMPEVWQRLLDTRVQPVFNEATRMQYGGKTGEYPTVTPGGVYNEQTANDFTNSIRAQASANAQHASDIASQGFGFATAESPLSQYLRQIGGQMALAGGEGQVTDWRTKVAELNARQRLAAEQAAIERTSSMGREDVARQGLANQAFQGLLQNRQGNEQNALAAQLQLGQPLQYSQNYSLPQEAHAASDLRGLMNMVAGPPLTGGFTRRRTGSMEGKPLGLFTSGSSSGSTFSRRT